MVVSSSLLYQALFSIICTTIALFIKGIVLYKILQTSKKNIPFPLLSLLLLVLSSEYLSDLTAISDPLCLYLPQCAKFSVLLTRIAWAFYVIEFQALSMFITLLINKKIQIKRYHYFVYSITLFFFAYFIGTAIFSYNSISFLDRKYEFLIMRLTTLYAVFLILPALIKALVTLKKKILPKILSSQLFIFITIFLIPKVIFDLLQNNLLNLNVFDLLPYSLIQLSINTLLTTALLYFCITRLLRIRFLNGQEHVKMLRTPQERDIFASYTRRLIPTLMIENNQEQFASFIQKAFHDLFKVKEEAVMTIIDPACFAYERFMPTKAYRHNKETLEKFKAQHVPGESITETWLYEERIAIYDEIEFSHYYDPQPHYEELITFLKDLNADVFIPLYENRTILGAIIIQKDARKRLYNKLDSDEMVSFGHCIASILLNFKYRRFENIAAHNKQLQAVAHFEHQRADNYQEGFATVRRERSALTMGLIQYSHKKFTPCTTITTEILEYDFNTNHHPLVSLLNKITHMVEQYDQPYEHLYTTASGKDVQLIGVPLEHNIIAIEIIPLDGIERAKRSEGLLNDPTDRDFLFFLETTKQGKKVTEFLPGRDPLMMNAQVALLKASMNRKDYLIQAHPQDVQEIVTLIHQLSERTTLHFLALEEPEKNNEIAVQLFGTHSPFDAATQYGLLEKLKDEGTLCIENIHLLSLETQKLLARFLRIGYFTPLRSSHVVASSVRLIATSAHNVQELAINGFFDTELAELLSTQTLMLPSLIQGKPHDYDQLIEGYVSQTLKSRGLVSFVQLTKEEKQQLYDKHPASFHELKHLIYKMVAQKITDKKIGHLIELNHPIITPESELAQAKKLGKHALKDKQLMTFLWHKFHNQSQIAQLLKVNRSSVCRRLKDLKLMY